MAKNRAKRRGGSTAQPDINKNLLWAAVAAAVAGMALSLYATLLTFRIGQQGIVEASGCSINDFINCDLAHASSYASLLGIPVAWWGFLFYAFAGMAALYGALTSNRRSSAGWIVLAFFLAVASVLYSVLKAFNLVELGVLCPVCIGMYGANVALAVLLPLSLGYGPARWTALAKDWLAGVRGEGSALNFEPGLSRWAIVALLVFGLGYVGVKREADRVAAEGGEVDMALGLAAHFRQTPVEVALDEATPVWGNPDAALKVVEFADFQCPACQQSAFHLRTALFEYRDRIAFYFMNYPLDSNINERMQSQLHAQAGPAARAAVCAAEFGDFWEYHDDLFRNQVSLSTNLYRRLAEDRGWSPDEFEACMARDETTDRVKADIASGIATGLNSTPTVFIGGRRVAYWRNSAFIREVIERELGG